MFMPKQNHSVSKRNFSQLKNHPTITTVKMISLKSKFNANQQKPITITTTKNSPSLKGLNSLLTLQQSNCTLRFLSTIGSY